MQVHFVHRHVLDTVVILEEGNFPHPRCALCNMLFPRESIEQVAPGHSVVPKWGETEETTAGGGGDAGEYGAGLRGLQRTHQECVGVYISRESADGGR